MHIRKHVLLLLLAVCAMGVWPAPGRAANAAPGEKIVSFHADVAVRKDATLDVREEFVLHSEATYFRWGMIRELPIDAAARWDTRYAGEWKQDTGLRVKILEVSEDGAPASYRQGSGWGYAQLEIGPRGVPVAAGDHRYVVRYAVEHALGPKADHDELYWNALGHYWQLPVSEASVTIHLPPGVTMSDVRAEARLGGRGVSFPRRPESELVREDDDSGAVVYRGTRLGPAQALSVVLAWPKGFVHAPRWSLLGHQWWMLAAPALVCLYYFVVWMRVGRDPERKSIVPRYEPPGGLSPAAVRYVWTTGSDARTMAGVLAMLAARGCLKIEPQQGKYRLTQRKTDAQTMEKLAPEEARVLEMLFEDGPATTIDPAKSEDLNRYVLAVEGQLQKRLAGVYFTRNAGWIALAVAVSFVTAMAFSLVAEGRDTFGLAFQTYWIFFVGLVGGLILEVNVMAEVRNVARGLGGGLRLLPGGLVLGALGGVAATLIWKMAKNVSLAFMAALSLLIVLHLVWAPLLRRMTPQGRQTLDEIEGFRQFLEKVDQDRMDRLHAPGERPEQVDAFLPYAIVLEVKEAWGDHLAGAFYATMVSR